MAKAVKGIPKFKDSNQEDIARVEKNSKIKNKTYKKLEAMKPKMKNKNDKLPKSDTSIDVMLIKPKPKTSKATVKKMTKK